MTCRCGFCDPPRRSFMEFWFGDRWQIFLLVVVVVVSLIVLAVIA